MNKSKEQNPLFYIQIVIGNLKFDALVDTGSFANALPMRIHNQIADSIVSKTHRQQPKFTQQLAKSNDVFSAQRHHSESAWQNSNPNFL